MFIQVEVYLSKLILYKHKITKKRTSEVTINQPTTPYKRSDHNKSTPYHHNLIAIAKKCNEDNKKIMKENNILYKYNKDTINMNIVKQRKTTIKNLPSNTKPKDCNKNKNIPQHINHK